MYAAAVLEKIGVDMDSVVGTGQLAGLLEPVDADDVVFRGTNATDPAPGAIPETENG